MKSPRRKAPWRTIVVLFVLLLVAIFWHRCTSVPMLAPSAQTLPEKKTASPLVVSGRDAKLSEAKVWQPSLVLELNRRRPALTKCIEQTGDPQLGYRIAMTWDGEGAGRDLRVEPKPSFALRECLTKVLGDVTLPPDAGLRDRHYDFDLKVR